MNGFNQLTQAYAFSLNGWANRMLSDPSSLSPEQKETMLWWEGYCDGSFQPNKGMLGIGGVLLNPYGQQSDVFSEASIADGREGSGSSRAEFEAAIRLLQLARGKGIRKLLLKMDNRGAARALGGDGELPEHSRMRVLLERAREEMAHFDEVAVQWIPRVKNRHADSLARAQIPEIPGEHARSMATRTLQSPKASKMSMVDESVAVGLSARHPGVAKIDRSYFLASTPSEKSKAIAKWKNAPTIRFHTEHGVGGWGSASGAQSSEELGTKSWIYCDGRSLPALAELRLMIRMLNKAKFAGVERMQLESSNQNLCLICSGLKEPPAHLRSAVLTFFAKAATFQELGLRHRAGAPGWADQLERAPTELGAGFHAQGASFEETARGELDIFWDQQSHLVLTRVASRGQETFSSKLAKTQLDADLMITRCLAGYLGKFAERGIKHIELGVGVPAMRDAFAEGVSVPEHMRVDWGQVAKKMMGLEVVARELAGIEKQNLVQLAQVRLPKPFLRAGIKLAQWRRSQESHAQTAMGAMVPSAEKGETLAQRARLF